MKSVNLIVIFTLAVTWATTIYAIKIRTAFENMVLNEMQSNIEMNNYYRWVNYNSWDQITLQRTCATMAGHSINEVLPRSIPSSCILNLGSKPPVQIEIIQCQFDSIGSLENFYVVKNPSSTGAPLIKIRKNGETCEFYDSDTTINSSSDSSSSSESNE